MLDGRAGASQPHRDMVYSYDGLHRLSEAKRGVSGGGGSFTYDPGSQKWSLDMLGNWAGFLTDLNGDGDYLDTDEETGRFHNDVNELTGIDLTTNGTPDLDLTYDGAGNLREEDRNASTSYRYTHDLWNRLVKIEIDKASTWEPVAEYEYFGTHWRSVKRSDTTGDQALDEQREMYYSAGWQLLEERIDDDFVGDPTSGGDRRMQYLWGVRYIDDIIWHREDIDGNGDFSDDEDLRWWHLSDVQFSTVAIIDDAANLAERIRYDAYGRALHHEWRDVDGDGDYDSTDRGIIANLAAFGVFGTPITSSNYRVEADLDRNGFIDATDLSLATTNYVAALAPGELSNSTVKNTIGWDGYVFNAETAQGGMYHVRFRWYGVDISRWTKRDPAGYVDGMSLYLAFTSAPIHNTDPAGLDSGIHPATGESLHPHIWDWQDGKPVLTTARSNLSNNDCCYLTCDDLGEIFRDGSLGIAQLIEEVGRKRCQYDAAARAIIGDGPEANAMRRALTGQFLRDQNALGKALTVYIKAHPECFGNPGTRANDPRKTNPAVTRLGRVYRFFGRVVIIGGITYEIYEVMDSPADARFRTACEGTGSILGAIGGGAVGGATAGALSAGPLGIVIGGLLGGAIGGFLGEEAVNSAFEEDGILRKCFDATSEVLERHQEITGRSIWAEPKF